MITFITFDELARGVFSFLCHQDPSRTFQPGGEPVAMCARCVGVYVGFLFALPLMIVATRMSGKWALYLHALFVLQVIPFGFHLIRHGPTVRAISGQLFAIGVVYLLFRAIRLGKFHAHPGKYPFLWLMRYLLITALAVVGLQLLLRLGWSWAGTLINVLALIGLAVFVVLAVVLLLSLGSRAIGPRQSA